ncbi:hypothetical protein EVAR_70878_1 [Eumeta japonica]|uniref:Uncharacterized protein n=1 Tax=Eumeta variegata TaxID=151549 RepID=A0A4C2AGH1_EUMVA|nr:hypothetical protein EVAR_70878_1 [Eumeta japonica]
MTSTDIALAFCILFIIPSPAPRLRPAMRMCGLNVHDQRVATEERGGLQFGNCTISSQKWEAGVLFTDICRYFNTMQMDARLQHALTCIMHHTADPRFCSSTTNPCPTN